MFDKIFLKDRKQRVALNRQSSSWTSNVGVSEGSILDPVLFLMYINDLQEELTSDVKLCADNTSVFSVVFDVQKFATDMNNDLKIINEWADQWKMSFTPFVPNPFSTP